MKSDLTVFRGLPIPVDYAATMKYAVMAKSNGGKTYLTLKMEEQLCDAGAFFVVLDPVGKHWALRVGKDGSTNGGKHDVYVLGGLHGDVPLEAGSGALIADTVLDHPGRYVLDVSQFDTDAEQDRFATDFAKRLFRRKAKDPGFPLLLILEEAESFIPQQPRPNQAPMLGAFGRIARQGRNHGLGLWLVFQRSAAANKGVLSQVDVLIVKEMNHKRDRDAVDDWVEANGTKEQRDVLMASLATLNQNEAWVWSPSYLECFVRTIVLPRTTFDSSANVKHGEALTEVELTPLDVGELGKAIAATAERAKADDPRELRKRIAELEREHEQLMRDGMQAGGALEDVLDAIEPDHERWPKGRASIVAWVSETIEALRTATHAPEDLVQGLEELESALDALRDTPLKDLEERLERALFKLGELREALNEEVSSNQVAKPEVPHRVRAVKRHSVRDHFAERMEQPLGDRTPPKAPPARSNGGADGDLGKAHRAVLTVLAQRGARTKDQLALETGYSAKGGGFNNALGRLRSLGYISAGSPIHLSPNGRAALGEYDPLPSGRQLMEHWMNHSQVPKAGRLVLEALDRHGPMTKQELAEACGYEATGGGFNNALGRLRSLGLVTKQTGARVELTPDFADAIR